MHDARKRVPIAYRTDLMRLAYGLRMVQGRSEIFQE